MNTENIKTEAIDIGLVTAGFMGANLVSKVVPIKNEKIKSLIPVLIGAGLTFATKNQNLKLAGKAIASYGLLKTLRTLLMGSDPMGTDGIEGIKDNPAVKKMLDMLIPNLGEVGEIDYANEDYTNYFEPAIIDVPFEEVEEMDGVSGMGSLEENSLLGSIEQESLVGFDYDYENEMYL